MRPARPLHALATIAALLAGMPLAASGAQATTIAVTDFGYLDTSNEPNDQAAVHQARLKAFMAGLRADIGADARFRLVASGEDGAHFVIVGNVQKTSTLVQWARAAAIDTAANRIVFEKIFTFRGDSDTAWQHAEAFVSEDIRTGLAALPAAAATVAAPAAVKLAVFPFELDDTSASAESTGEIASDASDLADTTKAIRQLLAQSGRYQLVDIGAAGADADHAQRLHECGGCDAQIARGLGAEQSLLGVVRRISRTEYIVGFKVRDTGSGAVVASGDSGLRMGANYSWSRGATRLVRDRLLETGAQ